MPLELWADNAATTLTSSPGVAATSFTVTSSTPFPAAVTGVSRFRVIIGTEIVTVTNVSGTTWTVAATAASHTSGDAVTHVVTAASLAGLQYPENAIAPAAADYETFPRNTYAGGTATPSTGVLILAAIALPAGLSVGHIAFHSGSVAAVSPTHWWFGLYNSSRVQLAMTADQTSTAWAVSTGKSLAVATIASGAASAFVTTYAGLHYLGFLMTAGTMINLAATTINTGIVTVPPILYGASDTAQTTPPAFAHTATTITPAGNLAYAYVGA